MENADDGIVDIHGKKYETVARRVKDFWADHPDYSLSTKLMDRGELVLVKATLRDPTGRILATGYAEEDRNASKINKTSAVENCETSAIGRCLGTFGRGGISIASADELAAAVVQQQESEKLERLRAHNAAVREHIESVVAIKAYLLNDEYSAAYEAMAEIPEEDRRSLWISTSAGGIWTTAERAQMKSSEWTEARRAHHGLDD